MDFKELYLPAPPLETVRVYQLGDITYAITDQQNNLLALAPRGFNLHGGFDGLSNFTNWEEGVHPSAYLGRVEEVNGDETGPIGTEFGKRVFPVKYFEPFSTGDEVCPIHIPSKERQEGIIYGDENQHAVAANEWYSALRGNVHARFKVRGIFEVTPEQYFAGAKKIRNLQKAANVLRRASFNQQGASLGWLYHKLDEQSGDLPIMVPRQPTRFRGSSAPPKRIPINLEREYASPDVVREAHDKRRQEILETLPWTPDDAQGTFNSIDLIVERAQRLIFNNWKNPPTHVTIVDK